MQATDQTTVGNTPPPRPVPVALQPATLAACAADYRTPTQQTAAAAEARTQLGCTRASAASR